MMESMFKGLEMEILELNAWNDLNRLSQWVIDCHSRNPVQLVLCSLHPECFLVSLKFLTRSLGGTPGSRIL